MGAFGVKLRFVGDLIRCAPGSAKLRGLLPTDLPSVVAFCGDSSYESSAARALHLRPCFALLLLLLLSLGSLRGRTKDYPYTEEQSRKVTISLSYFFN